MDKEIIWSRMKLKEVLPELPCYIPQSVQKNKKELGFYLEFRYLKQIFLTIFSIFFFLSRPGSAHSPEDFIFAGLSIILMGAGLAGVAKFFLIQKLKRIKPKLRTLYSIVVIELIVMILSQILSIRFSPERDSLTILLGGCIIYYIVAIFLNLILLKENNQKLKDVIVVSNIKLAAFLGIIFPTFLILLALTIFIPLYILFGG